MCGRAFWRRVRLRFREDYQPRVICCRASQARAEGLGGLRRSPCGSSLSGMAARRGRTLAPDRSDSPTLENFVQSHRVQALGAFVERQKMKCNTLFRCPVGLICWTNSENRSRGEVWIPSTDRISHRDRRIRSAAARAPAGWFARPLRLRFRRAGWSARPAG